MENLLLLYNIQEPVSIRSNAPQPYRLWSVRPVRNRNRQGANCEIG
ncbi:hypothetical protein [Paenibacillus sp. sgz302251]